MAKPVINTYSATIANGQSLSAALQLNNLKPLVIIMPADWDNASLTFMISDDGLTYSYLYAENGNPIMISPAQGQAFKVEDLLPRFPYMKIQSGDIDTPVNQSASRTIKFLVGQ